MEYAILRGGKYFQKNNKDEVIVGSKYQIYAQCYDLIVNAPSFMDYKVVELNDELFKRLGVEPDVFEL